MPNLTTNYDFNLPLVNNAVDADLWGGQLNSNWTSLDTLLKTVQDAVDAVSTIPIGSTIPYFGSSAPTNYLLCYGQTIGDTGSGADVEGSEYEALFDIAKACAPNSGTEDFANGDTVTIPDLRGRVVAGQDDMGGSSANRLTGQSGGVNGDNLGATGGAETHTLSIAQIPAHTHTYDGLANIGGSTSIPPSGGSTGETPQATGSAGSGQAHNNVQPTLILNYIVRYQ